MLAKAPELPAEAVVLDLEDAVPPAERGAARRLIAERLEDWPGDAPRPFVRIDSPRVGVLDDDLAVLAVAPPETGVLVPKIDRAAELAPLFVHLTSPREVIISIETPRSLLRVEEIADYPGVTGLFLGSEDLALSMGMARTAAGAELAIPRFLVVAAARAAGIAAYDAVCPEFRDLRVLEADARAAVAAGFDGKFAIHPAQLPVIRDAFTPSAEALDEAARIVTAYDQAVSQGFGAVSVDGRMIDPPVAERYRSILRRRTLVEN
jgi:citrate lyase subunit beta/citryl-CoA lyase